MKNLIKDIPYKKEKKFVKNFIIKNNFEYRKLIEKNWEGSIHSFNKKELKKLSINSTLEFVKKKLIELHDLNTNKLVLMSI